MKVSLPKILFIFIVWRILLFSFAWLGQILIPFAPRFPYSEVLLSPSGLPFWIWSFANFDGVHYLTIAKSGYTAQFTQVFFPLYPLLIRVTSFLIPILDPILIGFILSNLFFFASLIFFYKLLRMDFKDSSIKWILLFLVFFPLSFFFGTLYTESLFFLLVVSSFYAARLQKWRIAAIFGTFASATRFVGIFLLPALLWEWHNSLVKSSRLSGIHNAVVVHSSQTASGQRSNIKYTNKNYNIKKIYHVILNFTLNALRSPILYLVPLGLFSYMLYLHLTFGDALYFWHAQPIFGAQRSGGTIILLPQVIWRYFKILATVPIKQYNFWVAVWELSSLLVAFLLLVIATVKKVRPSYLIFSFLAVLVPTLTGTLSSMPRYTLLAIPMYIVLGMIKNKVIKTSILFLSFALLFIFTLLFTSGRWVS